MNARPSALPEPSTRPTLGDDAQVVLLRDNQIAGALTALVNAAAGAIFIVQYHFRPRFRPHPEMAGLLTAILAAAARGVAIRILLNHPHPPRRWTPRHGALYSRLRHDNIIIRHHNTSEILHTKLTVIDAHAVVLGSHNYSEPSFRTSKNVSVVIHSPSFALRLLNAYHRIWEDADNGPG